MSQSKAVFVTDNNKKHRDWLKQSFDFINKNLFSRARLVAFILLIILLGLRINDPDPIRYLRLKSFDLLQQNYPRIAAIEDRPVRIITIDETSLNELGQWPWPRNILAKLVDNLSNAGAASIGFDMVFPEPDRFTPQTLIEIAPDLPPEISAEISNLQTSDEIFAQSIANSQRTILGMVPTNARNAGGEREPPRQANFGSRDGLDTAFYLPHFARMVWNLDILADAAKGQGAFLFNPDIDGIVRRVPLLVTIEDRIYPSLVTEMLRSAIHSQIIFTSPTTAHDGIGSISMRGAIELTIPTDWDSSIWIRYAKHEPELYISASDIINNNFNIEDIKGRFIFIGATAEGLRDIRSTPLGIPMAGVEVHAQLLETILSGTWLKRDHDDNRLEWLIILIGGIIIIIFLPMMSARISLPLLLMVIFGLIGVSYYRYNNYNSLFDATAPAIIFSMIYTLITYGNFARTEFQRRHIRRAFSQYLSPALVKTLEEDPKSLSLGGESREMAYIFTDIAGYTSLTEQIDPELQVSLLNEYLDAMSEIIIRHKGTIDKFIGDAVVALFNAPLEQKDYAQNAVNCVRELDIFAREFSKRQQKRRINFGATRIGSHAGRAVVGNFGGSTRFDYTVLGDAMNTAARLEAINKILGTTTCISGDICKLCPDDIFRPIGHLLLKGKDKIIEGYLPEPNKNTKLAAELCPYDTWQNLWTLIELKSLDAIEALEEVHETYPKDPLISLYLNRLTHGEKGIIIDQTYK